MSKSFYILMLILLPSFVKANTIVVSQGDDLIKAYSLVSQGDTILIKKGIYECRSLELKKPMTLIGEEGAILDGMSESYILKIFKR